MSNLRKQDIYIALLVAAIAQIIYTITLAPTVTSEDSGEFIAAAYTFGVAHPPGFPLWCIIAKLFCMIPSSSPAWNVNLMSAIFGSLTAGLVYILCIQLSAKRLPAIGASLCLAFSRRFWSQAVIAEVYTLNTVLFCAMLICIFLWAQKKKDKYLYLASLFFGLGLTNHYMLTLLVIPPIFFYIFQRDRKIYQKLRLVGLCALIASACLLVYMYLPIAASGDPPMNWGNPSSWPSFVKHVTRTQYRTLELSAKVSGSTKLLFIGHFLVLFWTQFTPYILLPFVFLGWIYLRNLPRERLLLTGMFLFNTFLLLLILKFTFEGENISRVEEYYLSAYICAAIVIAGGLSRLPKMFTSPAAKQAALAFSLVAPLFPLLTHWRNNNMSNYYLAYDYNHAILQSLEKDAIYFQAGDYNAFPCIYLQAVEGLRPDVILADTTGRLSRRARSYVKALNSQIDPDNKIETQAEVIAKGSRPVYFTAKSDIKELNRYGLDPWGMVYKVRPKTEKPVGPPKGFFESKPLRNISEETSLDDMGESIISSYYLMRAETLMVEGNQGEAIKNYRLAADYAGSTKEGLNTIGGTCAERGLPEEAENLFRRASRLYPGYLTARRNLARLLETQGRIGEALAVYKELAEFERDNESLKRKIAKLSAEARADADPGKPRDLDQMLKDLEAEIAKGNESAVIYNNLGNVYAEKGDAKKALEAYHKAIKLDPKYFKVYKNLAAFYRDVMHDEETALMYTRRYQQMRTASERRDKS